MSILRSKRPTGPSAARAVHQFVPRLAWGDAVGNQARYLRELLRGWGYASEIYADQWDDECREQVRPVKDYPREADEDSALLIHHSFESRLVPLLARSPGRKALVYHNITPARLFEGFERKVAAACTAAREELLALRPLVECAWAYSRFSAEELVAAGFPQVSVLPFAVDWRAFDTPPDPVLRDELQDGCTNVLFVGRAVPSKRIDDVMRVFTAYQRLYQPRSRLLVAGYLNRESPYGAYLHGLKELLGAERVRFLGRVSAAQLSACFSVASVYLSMSRHEGFGVPLLEAMYRGVPVVAYGAAAVPETMDGAGVASLTDDPLEVARLLAVLEREAAPRAEVLAAQRARVEALHQEAVAQAVREGLRPFLEGQPTRTPPAHEASVSLVCPGFAAFPKAPESQLAGRLARRFPGARLLTLDPTARPVELAPRLLHTEGFEVHAFTPDEPLPRDGAASLPGSSSLEAAVRTSRAPVVFLPVDAHIARATLPHLRTEAWGLRGPASTDAGEQLGQRLLPFDSTRLEPTESALVQALRAAGVPHAS